MQPLFFQKYRFILEITEPMVLPIYKGSTLRGALLNAFKGCVCMMPHRNCSICPISNSCSYFAMFEPKISSSMPTPYIIEPPREERQEYSAGERLEFYIVLVGNTVHYWNLMVFAVQQIGCKLGLGKQVRGKRGKFKIIEVASVGRHQELVPLYLTSAGFNGNQPLTIFAQDFVEADGGSPVSTLVLKFLTPLCLVEQTPDKKQVVNHLDFSLLLARLLQRLSYLSELYCDGTKWERGHLLQAAESCQVTEYDTKLVKFDRYSQRQQGYHPLEGILGKICLRGDLAPYLPYLQLGAWLHAGKKSSFGFGHYQIEEIA